MSLLNGVSLLGLFILQGWLVVQGERISVQKCNEYRALSSRKCPAPAGDDSSLAEPGDFPHQVILGFPGRDEEKPDEVRFVCGGVLISERYVLTVAHCAVSGPAKPISVRLGDVNLDQEQNGEQTIGIESIVAHPKFNRSVNDIALIKLEQDVLFTETVQPACLDQGEPRKTAIESSFEESQRRKTVLKRFPMRILDISECAEFERASTIFRNGLDPEQHLCVTHAAEPVCSRNSGDPLQVPVEENSCTSSIIALAAFGKRTDCDRGVHVRVAKYLDWIESIVWSQ
ncbi:serine protease snake-like [Uranotaenia lowii]|uniref:serine protease snake-like n=1 Tax=Uranotaenia lowii TaxID=190385 RepID=UPI002478C93F|nr:serine protease snake-like [Uranotaenia lowii]XP_055597141.1 serine protease snake-like [Uranotaenia lowii]